MKHPLQKAVDYAGGRAKLAELLQKHATGDVRFYPELVHMWLKRRVPAEHCVLVERATGGTVKCHELRPDIFPRRVA